MTLRTTALSTLSNLFNTILKHATLMDSLKVFVAVLTLILFHYRSRAFGSRRRPDLKQPRGAVPLLGHMPLLLSVPGTKLLEFFVKQNEELGPIWSISLPFVGRMIECDLPDHIEHVSKTSFYSYEKGAILDLGMIDMLGKGIFGADGHAWKRQRRIAVNVMNVKAFREYTSDVFVLECKKAMDYLGRAADEGVEVDLHELFHKMTLDSFGTISFGKSFGCLDNMHEKGDFATSFDDLMATCSDRLMDPAWKIREAVTSVGKKAAYDKAVIGRYILELITLRRKEGYHGTRKDLLQLFIDAKDEDGKHIPDDVLKDEILNMTIAGRDTTAEALSWMFYVLGREGNDPEVMNQLIQEVDDVLKDELPTYETHKEQKYAEACLYESLRLYPSVPRNLRKCVKDDVLPDGTKIYKGEWFTWSSYVMGRSELVWGSDAKEYKPSRWIGTEKPSQGKFNSFHTGPRVCVGQQFATIQALTWMGMILSKYRIELVDPGVEPAYGISVTFPMLNGLPVRVHRRQNIAVAREA